MNARRTSEAARYSSSPKYRAKVADQIEWFTRGGKIVAFAVHVFYFKDPDNTLKVLDSKKAAAEFIFLRGVGDNELLEHDLKVSAANGNADEQPMNKRASLSKNISTAKNNSGGMF